MKPSVGKFITCIFFCALWLLALGIVFRSFILSGGDKIVGDVADGQLIQSIHEHWYRVYSGQESWRNLNIFYPVNDTLGYSDTFFLQGIPYSALRFLGVDMFIAFQAVQLLLASIGFFGMLHWLRHCRRIPPALAGWGAFLFVIASSFFLGIRNSHIQLLAIWMLPVILVFAEGTLVALHQPEKGLRRQFLLFSILYGGLAYSTFYAAFFLFLGLFLGLVTALFLYRPRHVIKAIWPKPAPWKHLLPGIVILGIWTGLFLWTYLPVKQDMGGRSLSSVLHSVPILWNIFNHSEYNLLWGKMNQLIWDYPNSNKWSFELCLPMITFSTAIVGSIMAIKKRAELKQTHPALVLSAGVILLSMLMMFRIGPVSLWAIPYFLVPGADAIRVVPRYNLALLIPVIFITCYFLRVLWNNRSLWTKGIVVLLVLLIGLEQIQLVEHSNISRTERMEIINLADPVPDDAVAFYAVGQPMWGWHKDSPHNSAMMLSQVWGLPTLNGRSGFLAKGWDLYEMDPVIAYRKIVEWAHLKNIKGTIYIYNLDTGRWQRSINFSGNVDAFSTNQDLMTLPEVEFNQLAVKGWSAQEHWGVWSNEPVAVIQFPGIAVSSATQTLYLNLIGFVNEEQPEYEVSVLLDGEEVIRPRFTRNKPEVHHRVPVQLETGQPWSLEFKVINPAPEDKFDLGVGIISLMVEE